MQISLLTIRDYIQAKRVCSLKALSMHFDKEPELMRCLLQHWVRKGVVRCQKKHVGCISHCTRCDPSLVELYIWQDCSS